jgi:hypothetical protein
VPAHARRRRPAAVGPLLAAVAALAWSLPAAAVTITINAGPALAANAAALAAFGRAASRWSALLTDPITVNVDANLAPLGPGVLGQAGPVFLAAPYATVRNALVADAADEPDDAIVASLPTAAQFAALVPAGFTLDGRLSGTKANFKALGFGGLDLLFGASDATIEFSSSFAFDYDASDGVGAGLIDFESVAAHELGHALGFISVADFVDTLLNDGATAAIAPGTFDLFRFGAGLAPATPGTFATAVRNLVPGQPAVFADVGSQWALSTGRFFGDGRQLSHWQDNDLSGTFIGLMDPTLDFGTAVPITAADLRALDLIGYEVAPVPLPAAAWLFAGALAGLGALRRRQ